MGTKGFFISVEGGDGVGKSTFMEALEECLRAKGLPLMVTREPGGSPKAEEMRRVFLEQDEEDTLYPESQLLLLGAARVQHLLRSLFPALNQGKVVLCDRFFDSTWVYQFEAPLTGCTLGEAWKRVFNLMQLGLEPHKTFLLDCPEALSQDRMSLRHPLEYSFLDEQESEQLARVRKGFLKRARSFPQRIVVLDASLAVEELVKQAWEHLEP